MYYYLLITIIIILILFILLLLMDKGRFKVSRDEDNCDITNATCWLYLKNKLDEKLDEKGMHPKGLG